jgi:hypothetical protein
MVFGLIFRIANPAISNETDKTRTDPDPVVLFHLPWVFAGVNLIAHLLPKCKPSTSSSTDETVSELTLDSELPPTPPPKTKAKRAQESKPRNPLLSPHHIHTTEEIRAAGPVLPPESPSPGCPSSDLSPTPEPAPSTKRQRLPDKPVPRTAPTAVTTALAELEPGAEGKRIDLTK